MGRGQWPFRGAVKWGAFAAGLVLILSIPTVALAALNTATFSSATPSPGSVSGPVAKISVIGYDRYGVKGSTAYAMSLDGRVFRPSIAYYYRAYGYRKFLLTYQVPSALSSGSHKVVVSCRDLKGLKSSYSWSFTVGTAVSPTTVISGALPTYPGFAEILLSATDVGGPGVAHTYYILDGGSQTAGTMVLGTFAAGDHTLVYWSVDTAGTAETHHTATFTVVDFHALPTLDRDASCVDAGCHGGGDIQAIHSAPGGPGCTACHGTGITPSSDCVSCHGASPHGTGIHETTETIASVPTTAGAPSCTQSTCHGADPMVVHTTCDTCHGSTNPTVIAAIAAGIAGTHATCETCHTSSYATLHAAGDSAHVVTSACFNSTCHTSDVSVIHTTGYGFSPHAAPPGCAACHAPGKTPSTNCFSCHTQSQLNAAHSFTHADASANAADANSTACTACHGTDLPTVHSGLGCFCHTASYLSEMAGLQAAGRAECADCHTGSYAAHGFDVAIASGHNTTTYGRRGAYSRFDGSQGVTLKDTAGNTVETTWGLPTADVFWSQDASAGADAPAAAMKTDHQGHPLGWNSVITCQDCHTGLNAAGPHGANDNWGIDPNYPEPYTDAINSHYTLSGVAARISPNSTSTGSTQLGVDPAKGMAAVTASMTANNEADGTSGSYAVICAKCHKLFDYTNAYKSGNYSAGSHGFTFINATGISNDSNTAHASHHWDITGNGAADCTNCHLAVPHGWIRPRLLVNGFTGPYVVNSGGVTMTVNSTADPAPYWAGRGMLSATGNYQGMGPLSSSDDHSLTASGGAVWTEANCIACAGGSTSTVNPSALEHSGVPTDAGKLK